MENKTESALNKYEERVKKMEDSVYYFWDFDILKNLFFWTSMFIMMLFAVQKTLDLYNIFLPVIVYKVVFPLVFLPLGIFIMVMIVKGIGYIIDRIRYGY